MGRARSIGGPFAAPAAGLLGAALVALGPACARPAGGPEAPGAAVAADRIFVGEVVTVDARGSVAEAVAVKGGRVLAVGSESQVLRHRGPQTKLVDLPGGALLPGFIDAHSHLLSRGVAAVHFANVARPPVGEVTDIASLVATLLEHARRTELEAGQWLLASGYERESLAEARDVTRRDLDAAFPDNPVVLIHVSGHGAVLNSRALDAAGIDAHTPAPPGGLIAREPGGREPAGLVMETAFFAVLAALPAPTDEQRRAGLVAAQRHYAANGYTTACDGATDADGVALLRRAAAAGELFLDVVALPEWTSLEGLLAEPGLAFGSYDGRLKLGGVKLLLDGSPQGRTAWFRDPYRVPGPGGESDWRGEPLLPREEVVRVLSLARRRGVQTFSHANGDAAIDLWLEAAASAGLGAESRPVVIHSQFARPDQLDAYARLGAVPSFFSNHTFFWGDTHLVNLGPERADFASPLRSARRRGLRFTNHSDYGVTPLDPLFLLWSASERLSRSGRVMGPEERIGVAEALRALTIDAAYQYFEEDEKGSIEVGKLADLVLVDRNPLSEPADTLRDIRVLETLKEGETVWRADGWSVGAVGAEIGRGKGEV